jgi:Nucleotide-diphospho-sugar transferase
MARDWAIVLFVTGGLEPFLENVLIGIERCGINPEIVHLIFPARAERELQPIANARGARARILEDLVEVSAGEIPTSYVEWNTPEFNKLLKYRFRAIRSILREGFSVVSSDIDVSWLRNPLPYLSEILNHYPWACQTEPSPAFPPVYCMGFFALRATPDTLKLIDLNIARNGGEADQTLFRTILIEHPKYLKQIFPLPESSFPTGLLYRSVQGNEMPPVQLTGQLHPFIFHANWCVGLESKRQLLARANAWLDP